MTTPAEARILDELQATLVRVRERAAETVKRAILSGDLQAANEAMEEARAALRIGQSLDAAFGATAVQPDPLPPSAPLPTEVPEPDPKTPAPTEPPVQEPPAPGTAEPAPVTEPPRVSRTQAPPPRATYGATGGASAIPSGRGQPPGSSVRKSPPKATPSKSAPIAKPYVPPRPRAAPKPKAPPPPPYDRSTLVRLLDDAVGGALGAPQNPIETTERKRDRLTARGLMAEGRDVSGIERLLGDGSAAFFADDARRAWPPETWFGLAECYRAVAEAEGLREEGLDAYAGGEKDAAEASETAALIYIESTLRTADDPTADPELAPWLDRLLDAHRGLAAMYRTRAENPAKRGELVTMARRIHEIGARVRREEARTAEIRAATEALDTLLREGGDFEAELPRRVERLLELGVPVTDPALNARLRGFEEWFDDAPGKKIAALREGLRGSKKNSRAEVSEPEALADAEYERKLEDVRRLTRGKVLGLVGGNKGQHERRGEIVAELQLEDLLWPDVEDATNVNTIYPQIRRADFVGLLVRFSRHSYQGVLQDAKADGKGVFYVTAGLNARSIVNIMFSQLVPRSTSR